MRKYIYEESDKLKLNEHIENQKKVPVYFKNSFSEIIKMEAWDEVIKWYKEGKDIEEYVKIMKHSIMSD